MRVRCSLLGMRWVYVRSVKAALAWPRYSLTALMLSPASSRTDAYQWRSACIPLSRERATPDTFTAAAHTVLNWSADW